MADQSIINAVHEMNLFILSQKGVSYYDVQNYAQANEKQTWLEALKNKDIRRGISEACKVKRRKDHVPYNTFFGVPYKDLTSNEE